MACENSVKLYWCILFFYQEEISFTEYDLFCIKIIFSEWGLLLTRYTSKIYYIVAQSPHWCKSNCSPLIIIIIRWSNIWPKSASVISIIGTKIFRESYKIGIIINFLENYEIIELKEIFEWQYVKIPQLTCVLPVIIMMILLIQNPFYCPFFNWIAKLE